MVTYVASSVTEGETLRGRKRYASISSRMRWLSSIYPANVRLLLLLGRDQTVQIQWLTSECEIQKYSHCMGQHFTNQAMLKMP